jgi:hypothetical protein
VLWSQFISCVPFLVDTTSFGQKSVGQMSWLKVNCSHPFA